MSLLLDHRWEHALVGAVIESAKTACPSCYLGRTAIQKLVYFLRVLNVPMQFQFRIHHFGPFCDELAGALDWLQADDIVADTSSEPRYSNFVVGTNWQQVKLQFEDKLIAHKDTIDSVAKVLGPMEPRILELIATLHYSFRWVQARGEVGPWKDRTIQKFKEIKADRFSADEISDWHERLVQANLIEA